MMQLEANGMTGAVKILYIEDDLGLARLLKKNLSRLGYQVELAVTGEEGLELLAQQPFDILLVDHNLPGMTGVEVITALRTQTNPIPIVMVTANGSELVAVEAMKRGANDYLVKDSELNYLQLLPVILEKLQNQQQMVRDCRRMMETLREQEDRYRRIMEGTSQGIMVSLDGRIELVNPAGSFLLGLDTQEQGVGLSVEEVFLAGSPTVLLAAQPNPAIDPTSPCRPRRELIRQPNGQCLEVEVQSIFFSYQGQTALLSVFSPPEE